MLRAKGTSTMRRVWPRALVGAVALLGWLLAAGLQPPPASAGPTLSWGDDEDHNQGEDAAIAAGVGLLIDLARKHHPYLDDRAIFEVSGVESDARIAALERRHHLAHVDQFASTLTGTIQVLVKIRRPVDAAVKELQADPEVLSAQPDYLYASASGPPAPAATPSPQYAVGKLRLDAAHGLATGEGVLVAIIDTAVDPAHPELKGSIAGYFDALGGGVATRTHGTSIAGLIVAHAMLVGAAPAARVLVARALDGEGASARGASFNVLKALDWSAASGARVVNMSLAGSVPDPALRRELDAAHRKGVVLIAAAGNGGATSPPLYPGSDPSVIAVAATDERDGIYSWSNRGDYIALAAPGVNVLVPEPGGKYNNRVSGTSEAAAEVSGVAALMLQRRATLTPDQVREILVATAGPVKPAGQFAPKLVNAYAAVFATGH